VRVARSCHQGRQRAPFPRRSQPQRPLHPPDPAATPPSPSPAKRGEGRGGGSAAGTIAQSGTPFLRPAPGGGTRGRSPRASPEGWWRGRHGTGARRPCAPFSPIRNVSWHRSTWPDLASPPLGSSQSALTPTPPPPPDGGSIPPLRGRGVPTERPAVGLPPPFCGGGGESGGSWPANSVARPGGGRRRDCNTCAAPPPATKRAGRIRPKAYFPPAFRGIASGMTGAASASAAFQAAVGTAAGFFGSGGAAGTF